MRLQTCCSTGVPENETPAGFLQRGPVIIVRCDYFAQQLVFTRQQAPPPQQSAEREVALAVPTSARAATILNRYFIEILRLSLFSALARNGASRRDRTGVRRAAAEQEVGGSGSAPKKCRRQKFRRPPADKLRGAQRRGAVRDQRRRGRNIPCPGLTSARAGRNRASRMPFSFLHNSLFSRDRAQTPASGLPRNRSSRRGAGRAESATLLASRSVSTSCR